MADGQIGGQTSQKLVPWQGVASFAHRYGATAGYPNRICGGSFLRSGRPRGPRKALQNEGGEAPHIFEGLPGPPGPARLQKCTKKIRPDCLHVPSTVDARWRVCVKGRAGRESPRCRPRTVPEAGPKNGKASIIAMAQTTWLCFRTFSKLFLAPPSPGGSRGRVRTVICLRKWGFWADPGPEPGG